MKLDRDTMYVFFIFFLFVILLINVFDDDNGIIKNKKQKKNKINNIYIIRNNIIKDDLEYKQDYEIINEPKNNNYKLYNQTFIDDIEPSSYI